MNLLTKYNRLLLLISMLGLFLISCIFYFTFNHYLDKQIDQDLEEETLEVKAYAKQGVFYKANNFEDLIIEYKEVKFLIHKTSLVDTFFYNPIKKYEEAARCLKTYLSINGKNYQVTVIASKFNRNEQAQRISVIIILPILVLLIIVLLVNRILMKKMWAPMPWEPPSGKICPFRCPPLNILLQPTKNGPVQQLPYTMRTTTLLEP